MKLSFIFNFIEDKILLNINEEWFIKFEQVYFLFDIK